MEKTLYEQIFDQELVNQEEILTDVDTGKEIIINEIVSEDE